MCHHRACTQHTARDVRLSQNRTTTNVPRTTVADLFSETALLARVPEALSRRLLDGVLVLAPDMAEPMHISTPGETLWALLSEPITVAELVGVLAEVYGATPETVRADILPVLRELQDAGAVQVTPAS